jgi:hypothetical protein
MIKPGWILSGGIILGIVSLITFLILAIFSAESGLIYKSILVGDILAFISFLLGLLFTQWGFNKPNKQFLISIYGGMLFRLIIMVLLLLLTLIFLEINEISFIFSNLFFYFFYVIVEIIYLNRREG